jgi:hypothetical protein
LGLLAGLQNTKGARVILFLVPLGLVAGVALAPLLPPVAVAALVDRASFVILGLLVALGRRLPEGLLAGLAMLFGVSHGYENALAMSADSLPHLFGPGVALWGLIVVTLTAATASRPRSLDGLGAHRRPRRRQLDSRYRADGCGLIDGRTTATHAPVRALSRPLADLVLTGRWERLLPAPAPLPQPSDMLQENVVAGAGFEPATFRL